VTGPAFPHRLAVNPIADRLHPYPALLKSIVQADDLRNVLSVTPHLPNYAQTPLASLSDLDGEFGLGAIYYKDESTRFGLGSFKGLGGAYALFRFLERALVAETGAIDLDALLQGKFRTLTAHIPVSCATDGNHGRSVAWGAKLFGCPCYVYLHEHVSEGREQAIAAFGARIVRVNGNYDDSVRQCQADAEQHGRTVISDTSYEGYSEIPRDVMRGYTLLFHELAEQLPDMAGITHVFVQAGVGAFPAAVCGFFWDMYGTKRPKLICVEPVNADCVFQSVVAGQPKAISGEMNTIMAGLACGEVSMLAWDILRNGCDFVVAIDDEAAAQTMRRLAAHRPAITAGESGAAGVAGLWSVCASAGSRETLGLTPLSRVLVFGTEGATDPELYTRIVHGLPSSA
jgi:diaminopropionate ammonia-lyase